MAKKNKIGNNSSNQEIIDYILNISSYEAIIDVEVNSNKSINKYKIKQKYIEPDKIEQEILEPKNIEGIKIIKKGNELKLENSKLNLSKIYNNYDCMTDNCLDLNTFIEEYKFDEKSLYEEKDGQIVMEARSNKNNNHIQYKNLYIDKETAKPIKMEVKDTSKKTTVYILYNEVKLNNKK